MRVYYAEMSTEKSSHRDSDTFVTTHEAQEDTYASRINGKILNGDLSLLIIAARVDRKARDVTALISTTVSQSRRRQ